MWLRGIDAQGILSRAKF